MRRRSQSGYVIMVLIFMMAALVIAVTAVAPAVKQQIQRDREVEMIHRGAQYSRAIKRYFKKFGRYPTSLDQLENTNNIRFLRKQYKDPMSADGKWKALNPGDVKLGAGLNIGTPASALSKPIGAQGQSATGPGATRPPSGATGQPAATGGTPSAFGSSGVIGGAIVGVVSTSELEGLHEFNEKTHYNEWYFFYDPTTDRGGLISGPFTGKTFAPVGGVGTPAGALGTPAGQQGSFGQPAGQGSFGQPAGQGGFGQPIQKPPQPPR